MLPLFNESLHLTLALGNVWVRRNLQNIVPAHRSKKTTMLRDIH